MKYVAIVALNTAWDAFHGYDESDQLEWSMDTVLDIEADDIESARESAFQIGNHQGVDATGKKWSHGVRSMSVGDVVTIAPVMWNTQIGATSWACESIGWRQLPEVVAAAYAPLPGRKKENA